MLIARRCVAVGSSCVIGIPDWIYMLLSLIYEQWVELPLYGKSQATEMSVEHEQSTHWPSERADISLGLGREQRTKFD